MKKSYLLSSISFVCVAIINIWKYLLFAFLLRYALLILDLSPEAATRGVLYKKTVLGNIAVFIVIAIFSLQMAVVDCENVTLISILILKAIDST